MALDWLAGQPYSSRFDDVYFSTDSGLEESCHVFLQGNDLAERFAALSAGANFCIGETGFGTGLNFLCAWQLFEQVAPRGASLDFFSVEKFPLSDGEMGAALALWPALHGQAEALLARWHRRVPGWNRWSFAGGRARLTLAANDVAEALPQLPAGCVDAWFLDGFAPAKNPEMWGDEILKNIARASRGGATLATYTSAGWVRRGLQQAGFAVQKMPGFGHKREMMRGSFLSVGECLAQQAASKYERKEGTGGGRGRPCTALVIGGGIAGCAAAHALAQRGITVTLIDRAPRLASAASGNPRGILHARFGAGDNPLHRFVREAYAHALNLLDEVLPVDGVMRAECGLLQLACNPAEQKRIARLAEQQWPEHLLQFVDAAQASRLAGVEMSYGGLWFPAGGWVVPPVLCANLVSCERSPLPNPLPSIPSPQSSDETTSHSTKHDKTVQVAGYPASGRGSEREKQSLILAGEGANEMKRNGLILQRLGHDVETLEKTVAGWCVGGHDSQGKAWSEEAEIVLVCCAHSAKKLAPFAHFPLIPVRGQITEVQETSSSKALRAVVCGDGYCAPAVGGVHVTGATHAFEDESTEVRATDHAENLAKLGEYAPHLFQALNQSLPPLRGKARMGVESLECSVSTPSLTLPLQGGGDEELSQLSGRASIRCSAPGSMPLVGKVQEGLYCSLAHGTRGLLTAGLAGEVLAAQICGQLPPLPAFILAALDPLRRVGK